VTGGAGPRPVQRARSLALALALALGWAAALACAGPPSPDALVRQGHTHLALREVTEAAARFSEALEMAPGHTGGLAGMARVRSIQGRPEAAMQLLDELAARHPDRWRSLAGEERCRVWEQVALRRQRAGRLDDALALTDARDRAGCSAAGTAQLRARLLTARAELWRRRHESRRALADYRAALEADPSALEALVGTGELLLATGQFREAARLLSEGLKHHPRDARLRRLMVAALSQRGGAPAGR